MESSSLIAQPSLDRVDYVCLLVGSQLVTLLNAMPFRQTSATTCGGRMLCDEYRVTLPRRLSAIILRFRGRQSLRDEIPGVVDNG